MSDARNPVAVSGSLPAMEAYLERAAGNLQTRLPQPLRTPVVVIFSDRKAALACALAARLHGADRAPCRLVALGGAFGGRHQAAATEAAREGASTGTLVLLIDPAHAPWLFEVVGRPDQGMWLPETHLYCDWMLSYEGLLRVLQPDYAGLLRWRARLLDALADARAAHIVTPAGTDLHMAPGGWLALDGEVCTSPAVRSVDGTLVIDGALYSGPPQQPVTLRISRGRVTNLDDLDQHDPRQGKLFADLTRDGSAALVAELGIGINPRALPDADLMEAEMARGTLHVGFGESHFLGGVTSSLTHVDVGLRRPTLELDDRTVCSAGRYGF